MPGVIESYIHTGNQIGVLVEINCQNEVTATTPEFKTLAKEIALQIAASPNVRYTKASDVPPSIIEQIDRQLKPEARKREIIQKRIREICLYDRPYIRDDSITIEDLIELRIARLGEKIAVKRFVRFIIDESTNNPPGDFGSGVPSNPLPNAPTFFGEEAN